MRISDQDGRPLVARSWSDGRVLMDCAIPVDRSDPRRSHPRPIGLHRSTRVTARRETGPPGLVYKALSTCSHPNIDYTLYRMINGLSGSAVPNDVFRFIATEFE